MLKKPVHIHHSPIFFFFLNDKTHDREAWVCVWSRYTLPLGKVSLTADLHQLPGCRGHCRIWGHRNDDKPARSYSPCAADSNSLQRWRQGASYLPLQKNRGATWAPRIRLSGSERVHLEAGNRMIEVPFQHGAGLGALGARHRAAGTKHATGRWIHR